MIILQKIGFFCFHFALFMIVLWLGTFIYLVFEFTDFFSRNTVFEWRKAFLGSINIFFLAISFFSAIWSFLGFISQKQKFIFLKDYILTGIYTPILWHLFSLVMLQHALFKSHDMYLVKLIFLYTALYIGIGAVCGAVYYGLEKGLLYLFEKLFRKGEIL